MKNKHVLLVVTALVLSVVLAACGKSDADVQKAVQAKLTADGVTGVTAAVKDGVATLSGEVADITVKNKAEGSAKGVDGV
jgi:osmotically-inducible protein OsmY